MYLDNIYDSKLFSDKTKKFLMHLFLTFKQNIFIYIIVDKRFRIDKAVHGKYSTQGGRGNLTVNYTETQSFITAKFCSVAQKPLTF